LRNVVFQNSAGCFTDGEVRNQNQKLHFSILLANQSGAEIKIVFNTTLGYRELNAAVWGATEKFILLQGGTFLPLECVAYIEQTA